MQDETKPGTESRKRASSVTKQATDGPLERGNTTRTPGERLAGLSVFQIDQPHQHTLAHLVVVTARKAETTRLNEFQRDFSRMNMMASK